MNLIEGLFDGTLTMLFLRRQQKCLSHFRPHCQRYKVMEFMDGVEECHLLFHDSHRKYSTKSRSEVEVRQRPRSFLYHRHDQRAGAGTLLTSKAVPA